MVEIKGSKALETRLKRIADFKSRAKPFLLDIANEVKNEIRLSFEEQSSPFGQDWKELKESTKKSRLRGRKGKRAPILRILDDTGDLRSKWSIKTKSDNEILVVGSAKSRGFPYGLTHNYGSNRAGRGRKTEIPARPFVPINKDKISKTLKKAITNAKKKLLKLV
ncbi:MAG: phage virion morphogenesis protein [Campylobacter sp.]|nr:phage virion morphogenesis protein [Campylobacter sp.]